MTDKVSLRRKAKHLKGLLAEEDRLQKSALIWRQIEVMERFRNAHVVLMYWSMPDEVQTHDFVCRWSQSKTIILPVVDGDRLRLVPFEGEQSLRRNATMNLYEPQGDDYPTPQSIGLAIIPGIAFDRSNHRLGRGKGYYDKLLPGLNIYKIGVGFDFQLLDSIPADGHDVLMDEVIVG